MYCYIDSIRSAKNLFTSTANLIIYFLLKKLINSKNLQELCKDGMIRIFTINNWVSMLNIIQRGSEIIERKKKFYKLIDLSVVSNNSNRFTSWNFARILYFLMNSIVYLYLTISISEIIFIVVTNARDRSQLVCLKYTYIIF